MKATYIAPRINIIQLSTDDNIAQFVISSHSVGENEGLAKQDLFDDADPDDENMNNAGYNTWEE